MSARPIRRFTEMLGLLDQGKFEHACDEALANAFQSLADLPKEQGSAKITIEITVAYDSGRVDIAPTIKSKLPEGQAFGRTPFWMYDGALSTQHPNQMDMFVREAAPSATGTDGK